MFYPAIMGLRPIRDIITQAIAARVAFPTRFFFIALKSARQAGGD